MPAGEHGGEALNLSLFSMWEGGMLMFKGFILGGDGISSLSMLSGSSIND